MKQTILDHGYLELVDTWGSDATIVSAARMSTGKGLLGWGPLCPRCNEPFGEGLSCATAGCQGGRSEAVPGDEKLLRYLWENKHETPFEMAGATFEVQAPIFVFREWHRHRVPFGYNEMSGRYTPLPALDYVANVDRLMVNARTSNKQANAAAGSDVLTEQAAKEDVEEQRAVLRYLEEVYQRRLKRGVPKELARTTLPFARYSRMRATGNLRGWLAFLTLRAAPNAQWEIRQFAQGIEKMLAEKFPRTLALYQNGKK